MPAGLLIINSSLIKETAGIGNNSRIHSYPFSDLAIKLGNPRVANMVALGCYLKNSRIIQTEQVLEVIEKIAPSEKRDLIEINKKALLTGMELE